MGFLYWTSVDLNVFEEADLLARVTRCVNPRYLRRSGLSRERYLAYLMGRVALLHLFRELRVESFVRPNREHGFLELVDRSDSPLPGLFANVSHSGTRVTATVASSPVGIDVERLGRDASRALRRVIGDAESDLLGREFLLNGQKLDAELALWCSKEAASKATGLGIVFGMKVFRIHAEGELPYRVEFTGEGPLALRDPHIQLEVRDGYLNALCSGKQDLANRHFSEFSLPTL